MDRTVDLNSMCVGCLTKGRRFERLTGDARRYFADIQEEAGEEGHHGNSVEVCWECAAGVRAALRLRACVIKATTALLRHQEYQQEWLPMNQLNQSHDDTKFIPNLTSLSRLSCSNTTCLDISHEGIEDTKAFDLPETSFIKLEDREESNSLEDMFVDDLMSANECDLKTEVKSGVDGEATKNHKTRKKTRKKKKSAEEFDESDDEPLTLKKLKQENSEIKEGGTGVSSRGGARGRGRTCGRRGGRRERGAGVVRGAWVQACLQRLGVPADAVQVVTLSWEEVEAERQRALSSEQYLRHEHRCELCALGFNHRAKLHAHMLKHELSAGELECSACHVRCRAPHALAAHRRRHRLRWRCVWCGGQWSRAAVAADHLARAHRLAPPTHACPECEHTATSLGKLRTHMKSHGAPQRCELCGKMLRDRASLRTHLQIHRGEKEHACPAEGCGKRFVFKKAMQLHAATHQTHQHLYCHQCDATFKNQTTLSAHLRYHRAHVPAARLRHACADCPRRFLCARRLAEHRAAAHTRTHIEACGRPECGFTCASRSVLRAHERSVHRGVRARRDHVCHTCGKAYTSRKTLEGHLRAHAGERPYRCAACPAAFTYHAALYNHARLVHNHHKHKAAKSVTSTDPPSEASERWPPAAPAQAQTASTTHSATS